MYDQKEFDLSSFPGSDKSKAEHNFRMDLHKMFGNYIGQSTQKFLDSTSDLRVLADLSNSQHLINTCRGLAQAGKFELASNHPENFGAVGTIEHCGCVVLAPYNALSIIYNSKVPFSFSALTKVAVSGGYRKVCFEKRRRPALGMPVLTMQAVLEAFPDDPDVQNCKDLKDVQELLGNLVGIGGSMFFIDELIGLMGHVTPYMATRLYTFSSILDTLSRGIPVTIRVNYGHMLNDPTKTEGHYVNLVGFEDDHAVIVDSSIPGFIYECPSRRFLESMIMDTDRGLTCVWNLAPLVNKEQH